MTGAAGWASMKVLIIWVTILAPLNTSIYDSKCMCAIVGTEQIARSATVHLGGIGHVMTCSAGSFYLDL